MKPIRIGPSWGSKQLGVTSPLVKNCTIRGHLTKRKKSYAKCPYS